MYIHSKNEVYELSYRIILNPIPKKKYWNVDIGENIEPLAWKKIMEGLPILRKISYIWFLFEEIKSKSFRNYNWKKNKPNRLRKNEIDKT